MRLWNLMGGEIQWAALPWLAEWVGCEDLDGLVELLVTLRTHVRGDDTSSSSEG
jgi:hypothetical protein